MVTKDFMLVSCRVISSRNRKKDRKVSDALLPITVWG